MSGRLKGVVLSVSMLLLQYSLKFSFSSTLALLLLLLLLLLCTIGFVCVKFFQVKGKGTAGGLGWPWGFQEVEAPRFQDNRHKKVARLSALSTGQLYPPAKIPDTHFCYRLGRSQGHSAAGRIVSMKNYNDTIRNRNRDHLDFSLVPQPNAPPGAPTWSGTIANFRVAAIFVTVDFTALYIIQHNV